jgi:ferredoxin
MTLTIHYQDRPSVSFDSTALVSVLVGAQRAGVSLRHDCGGKAQCGTCRVFVESGKGSPVLEREKERLQAVGAAAGQRLACQMHPAGDLTLRAILPLKH